MRVYLKYLFKYYDVICNVYLFRKHFLGIKVDYLSICKNISYLINLISSESVNT